MAQWKGEKQWSFKRTELVFARRDLLSGAVLATAVLELSDGCLLDPDEPIGPK